MARILAADEIIWIGDKRCAAYLVCSEVGSILNAGEPVTYEVTPGKLGGEFKSGNRTLAIHNGDKILDARTGKEITPSLQLVHKSKMEDHVAPAIHARQQQDLLNPAEDPPPEDIVMNPITGKMEDVLDVLENAEEMLVHEKYEMAIRYADVVLGHDPSNLYAMYIKSDAHTELGRFADAHAILDALIGRTPVSPQAARVMALLLEYEGRYQEGLEFTEKQLAIRPYDKHMIHCKIALLDSLERGEDAIEFIRECLDVRPEEIMAMNDRYMEIDLPGWNFANKMLEKNPERVRSVMGMDIPPAPNMQDQIRLWQFNMYDRLARMLCDMKRYEEGLECAEHSIKLASPDPLRITLHTKAKILAEMGRDDEAIACANEFVKAANDSINDDMLQSLAHRRKSEILLRLDQYEEAEKSGRRALQLDPKNADIKLYLADMILQDERHVDAMGLIDDVLADNPCNAYAMRSKIYALTRMSLYEDALACVKDALAINDQDSVVQRMKSIILSEMQKECQ